MSSLWNNVCPSGGSLWLEPVGGDCHLSRRLSAGPVVDSFGEAVIGTGQSRSNRRFVHNPPAVLFFADFCDWSRLVAWAWQQPR